MVTSCALETWKSGNNNKTDPTPALGYITSKWPLSIDATLLPYAVIFNNVFHVNYVIIMWSLLTWKVAFWKLQTSTRKVIYLFSLGSRPKIIKTARGHELSMKLIFLLLLRSAFNLKIFFAMLNFLDVVSHFWGIFPRK